MKITKVDVLHLKTNLKNGHWRPIVCRIYTDEGIYGDGEAALPTASPRSQHSASYRTLPSLSSAWTAAA